LPSVTWRGEVKMAALYSVTAARCFSVSAVACRFYHLLQQLGMAEQIFLDDDLDLAALIAGEGLRARGCRGWRRQHNREQRGGEWARIKFHRGSSFCRQLRKKEDCGGL
jgi:hypothetical protein